MNKEKLLILVGGPNGCGKSSIYEALRSRKNALPFLNADLIAVASHGAVIVAQKVAAGVPIYDKALLERVEEYAKG